MRGPSEAPPARAWTPTTSEVARHVNEGFLPITSKVPGCVAY